MGKGRGGVDVAVDPAARPRPVGRDDAVGEDGSRGEAVDPSGPGAAVEAFRSGVPRDPAGLQACIGLLLQEEPGVLVFNDGAALQGGRGTIAGDTASSISGDGASG